MRRSCLPIRLCLVHGYLRFAWAELMLSEGAGGVPFLPHLETHISFIIQARAPNQHSVVRGLSRILRRRLYACWCAVTGHLAR